MIFCTDERERGASTLAVSLGIELDGNLGQRKPRRPATRIRTTSAREAGRPSRAPRAFLAAKALGVRSAIRARSALGCRPQRS
jgi:hypothetical protein